MITNKKIILLIIITFFLIGCDQSSKAPQNYSNKTNWIYSEDKKISIRAMTDKFVYRKSEPIYFKIEQKNNSNIPLEIIPFLDPRGYTCGTPFSIKGPNEASYNIRGKTDKIIKYKYFGPCKSMSPPMPVTVQPQETISQIYIFTGKLWDGLDVKGEYLITPGDIDKLTIKIKIE